MDNSITHVYCMPGMAANPSIFEHIQLPTDKYELHWLSWKLPEKGESLFAYANRMVQEVKHPNPVLLGVSFGGILVQEMAKVIPVKRLIIVSSVKSKHELPKKMIWAKYTKVYKLLPTGLVSNIELLARYAFGDAVTKRLALYEKYLSVRDKKYIDWSLDCIINWDQEKESPGVIHIHGDKDPVFPIQYIQNAIVIKGGTHIIIINKYKWFNENLEHLIEEGIEKKL